MENIVENFNNLSAKQIDQYKSLEAIYRKWNERLNLISRKDISNLYINHILHSLAIAKIKDFTPNTRIIDVGTGGGFPGIPLAIMYPNVDFYLIDSIKKKIDAVKEISDEIGLKNITFKCIRSENFYPENKFDFVVARAVSSISAFYSSVSHLLKVKALAKNSKTTKHVNYSENIVGTVDSNIFNCGIFYLKGSNYADELKNLYFMLKVTAFEIKNVFPQYKYFIGKSILYIQ